MLRPLADDEGRRVGGLDPDGKVPDLLSPGLIDVVGRNDAVGLDETVGLIDSLGNESAVGKSPADPVRILGTELGSAVSVIGVGTALEDVEGDLEDWAGVGAVDSGTVGGMVLLLVSVGRGVVITMNDIRVGDCVGFREGAALCDGTWLGFNVGDEEAVSDDSTFAVGGNVGVTIVIEGRLLGG